MPERIRIAHAIYDRDTILFHYESFNHEAIDKIPPTPEGSGGGPFAALWALVGTVEDFDDAGIAKIKVDRDQSSGFILDTAYLNANAPIEGGGVIAIGDKIECRFLYDSNSEIIDPGKSGYIRIVDSGAGLVKKSAFRGNPPADKPRGHYNSHIQTR